MGRGKGQEVYGDLRGGKGRGQGKWEKISRGGRCAGSKCKFFVDVYRNLVSCKVDVVTDEDLILMWIIF